MLINPWNNMTSKKQKMKMRKENQRKIYFCNICEIVFMYDEGLFVLNIHNHWTICKIQFNDFRSLIHNCF